MGDGNCEGIDCEPAGCQVVPGDDCDDTSGAINPGVEEVCDDGVDNDCDLMVDEKNPGELLEETFNSVADTTARADMSDTNFGTSNEIKVDGSPERIAYLRFNVTGLSGTVQSARLRLEAFHPSVFGGTVHTISDNSWNEYSITYNNRPVIDGAALDSLGGVDVGDIVEFDVTAAINGEGMYSFAIDSDNGDGLGYLSREDSISPPELIISVNTNDAPVAVDDTGIVLEGDMLNVAPPGVLGNDDDANCNLLTANTAPVSGPAYGIVILNVDGSYEYIHDGSETTGDNFVYEVSDSNGATAFATVNIKISPQNDAPMAVDDTGSVLEGGTLTVEAPGVLVNDSDAEGSLTVSIIPFSDPANGTLSLHTDGSYEYIHDGSETISDSFVYEVTDSNGATTTATVSITVTPQNDAPVAVDDTGSVLEGGTLSIAAPGVLGNDSDAEGDAMTVNTTSVSNPAHGTVMLNADGSYEYIHNGSEISVDSFVYEVSDGNGGTDTSTVNITARRQKIAPVSDNFNDNVDDGWTYGIGNWLVENGQYSGYASSGEIAVSSMDSTVTSDALFIEADYLSRPGGVNLNGFIIFDYLGPTDFKYAGARVDAGYWTIGYYNGSWNDMVTFNETIDPLQWYRMRAKITGTALTLYVNDNRDGSRFEQKVEYTYSIMTSGKIGLATDQSRAFFDNFEVYAYILYYVSPNGSDNNNGSINTPFRTIPRAIGVVQPGDTVLVREIDRYLQGGYPEFTIVVQGDSSYLVFDGFELTDSDPLIDYFRTLDLTNPDDLAEFKSYLNIIDRRDGVKVIGNLEYLTFTNLEIHHLIDMGFSVSHSPSNIQFINNHVYDLGWPRSGYGWYINGRNHLIKGNIVHNNPQGILSSEIEDSIIEDNILYDNGGTFYHMSSNEVKHNGSNINIYNYGANNVIRNNISYGAKACISVYCSGAYINSGSGNEIYNNTFYDNGTGVAIGSGGNTVRNNILYNNGK
jgi:VCBS repeat-containing protein/parallel beta-helix repeat protein